jgi:predicted transcriptional regulator of viral defense system
MIKKITIISDSDIGNLIESLAATGLPVISEYELGRAIFLKLSALAEGRNALFRPVVEHLKALKIFVPLSLGGTTNAYQLFGHSTASPQQIACALDPFAYVSHLSAMEYHGLTDRFPKILYLTRPPAGEWRRQAEEKMRRDLGTRYEEYLASRLPRLVRPKLSKIAQVNLHFQERSQLGAFKHVGSSNLRVATIGRVFLEMTREPQLCGGIQHVIDVFSSNAKRYFRLVVDEYERHGKAIDKVRAGYLLTEICNLTDSVVENWSQFAQRGGSRKLDSETEYAPEFSERWKLSINVPSLTRYDE